MQRLDNGNTLIIWSTAGQIDEIDGSDSLVTRISSEFGYAFGYGQRITSLYPD